MPIRLKDALLDFFYAYRNINPFLEFEFLGSWDIMCKCILTDKRQFPNCNLSNT